MPLIRRLNEGEVQSQLDKVRDSDTFLREAGVARLSSEEVSFDLSMTLKVIVSVHQDIVIFYLSMRFVFNLPLPGEGGLYRAVW